MTPFNAASDAFQLHPDVRSYRTTLDVTVDQKYGFHAFLLATIASLLLGHVATHAHRVDVRASSSSAAAAATASDARPTRNVRHVRRRVVGVAIGASFLLLVVGARARSIAFEFEGLAGFALRVAAANGADAAAVRLLPIRPRSRGARRSLRTFPVVTLHPRFPFNVRLTGKSFD
jgi:hypothetical protein